VEARREDRKPYPPASTDNIFVGLYRYIYSKSKQPKGESCPNCMNKRDLLFCDLMGVLQVRSRVLREEGGATVWHVPAVTTAEEGLLWESNMIGDHYPLALLRAIFFV
jgi:hypothetical protein